jgi:hypothetical protein
MMTMPVPIVKDGRRAKRGNWLTVAEVAAARDVSRPAVRQALKTLAARGSPVKTARRGATLLINIDDYDTKRGGALVAHRVIGEATKRRARASIAELAGDHPVMAREQARKMRYEAELKRLELDRQLGKLIDAAELQQAALDCGATLASQIERIVMQAEAVYAVRKDGVAGIRAALRSIARDLRASMAEALNQVAAGDADLDLAHVSLLRS